ncbi:PQQ-binding-like beta-propeller repeat protein [Kitasatospora sp. NPDC093806]|uniref:outer membrane protein assembly factor BamB family protein n=1 Tax=Kitasatospora sp. NPDC093806 TaxID=3155075 RepID=UPI00341FC860
MGSTPSEGSSAEASWQWDGDAGDGAGAPGDVVSGGADGDGGGPWLSRRRLLLGAGVLAAGAAVWGVSRAVSDPESAPGPAPAPVPTRIAGPEPLWTYHGSEAMTPGRLSGRLFLSVYPTRSGLRVLDPNTGAVTATIDVPRAKGEPEETPLVVGAGRLFTASPGHVDARSLAGPAADWSLPLPPELGERITLYGCDGNLVYGRIGSKPFSDGGHLFALDAATHALVWSRPPAARGELLVSVLDTGAGRLFTWDSDPTSGLSLLDGATGRRLWSTATTGMTGPGWSAVDQRHVYLPDGPGGVRALRLEDGAPRWSVRPGPSEEWRALPPVSDDTRVYVLRDSGLITAHAVETGEPLWQHQLPFRLDRRSRPLLTSTDLIVPGPAAAGVHFIRTATGEEFTTFADSGPGVDVWSVSSDGTRLFAGHDSTLYCLGALPVP